MHLDRFLEEEPLDMREFNPGNVAEVAAVLMETLHSPRRRQILQNFIDHATAECNGDHDALMASCSRKRQSYAYWATGAKDGRDGLPQSYEELVPYYRGLIEANMHLIHLDVEKLIVGDDDLMVEGIVHQLIRGNQAPLMGLEVDDPGAVYQLSRRTLIIFVFDEDSLGCGEHSYVDGPTLNKHLSKVEPDLVPEVFWNNPLTGKIN
ncbi:MAG: hypothetical protein OXC05_10780 [Halieaceae bacterium]|nr:hypothetical protein [Halieaceae bacterium]